MYSENDIDQNKVLATKPLLLHKVSRSYIVPITGNTKLGQGGFSIILNPINPVQIKLVNAQISFLNNNLSDVTLSSLMYNLSVSNIFDQTMSNITILPTNIMGTAAPFTKISQNFNPISWGSSSIINREQIVQIWPVVTQAFAALPANVYVTLSFEFIFNQLQNG